MGDILAGYDGRVFDYAAHGLIAPRERPTIPGGGPQTVVDVLCRGLADDPHRLALVGRHGRLSYADLDAASRRAAGALRGLGVAPGDRVAACLPNDVDIVVAFLGTLRAGALWVGINRPLAAPEKAYLLADCGARVMLAAPDVVEEVASQRASTPELRAIVEVDPTRADGEWASRCAEARDADAPVDVDPFAPAAIAYTSGTTGHPKGAVHSQHNLLLPGAVSAASGSYPDAPQGVVLPLTILNLIVLGPMIAFQHGVCCVAIDRIDPLGLARWVRDERVASFAGVPTLLHDLLTHPDVKPADLETLVHPVIGGATVPQSFRDLYRERFGAEVSIGYGMTEAPTAVTHAEGAEAEPGYCGRALPQVEITIRDAEGRLLPEGEEGEICVGPARSGDWAGVYTPMLGYWGRPDATREALRDGAYHTGDVGVMRDGGVVYIRGRRNELILRGGANVYPAEVERVLASHPSVAACAVLGVPDERLGQRVVAAVVARPGADVAPDDLRAHCRAQLARYKVPERIVVVDDLPRNAMSKVIKRRLEPLF
jgi:acyl-CoA synthetase (AMP-forming)/AMP-acid ligase II